MCNEVFSKVMLLFATCCVSTVVFFVNIFTLFTDDDNCTSAGSDAIISKHVLSDLCNEAAKLKTMGIMNKVC